MKICAPFAGIVYFKVSVGDVVSTGQELASVEAVKLETAVVAPGPGKVAQLHKGDFEDVLGGDVLLTVVEA
ncbi:MAG: biotin/lipoyl-containing protein [Corynebacterium sp.]|uniref:biotin/lipoyl-containing protein n=1 Tax=Corynebacterium sp. TaxID=1720 RepID=UPI0026DB16B2|nr:biotin/lipoyl-containing protein [Corynebacterium sp.]MDO4762356.1 biotin/lipoyl-containing protein [Corynebacterium sp.]